MSRPDAVADDPMPRRFPPWFGLIAGASAACGYYFAGERGYLPTSWWGASGRWMVAVHGASAYALASLVGERLRQGRLAATLRDHERPGGGAPGSGDWVGRAVASSFALLRKRPSHEERRAAIEEVRSVMERSLARGWRIPLDLAFVTPAAGCLLSLLNLRLVSNAVPWTEIGVPFAVAVAEAMAVILLATWVARDARALLDRWKLVAEGLAASGRSEGAPPVDEPAVGYVQEETFDDDDDDDGGVGDRWMDPPKPAAKEPTTTSRAPEAPPVERPVRPAAPASEPPRRAPGPDPDSDRKPRRRGEVYK